MNAELFFIYDSHCPWSYAASALIEAIDKQYPDMPKHLWHIAHYDGSDSAGKKQVEKVAEQSVAHFGMDYIRDAEHSQDATMAANFLAWTANKQPHQSVKVLCELQRQHFVDNVPFTDKADFDALCQKFKLSPPGKVFKDSLSRDAEYALSEIEEIQEVIQTKAFPALLLAVDDNLVLLNHNLYLTNPKAIVDAVALELK
ncbi:protein-disulfide isomerase [Thalassotalea maritima]|uniref:protein-disulfide isomerase n=1 Tax=Thalassotalea maritima TaxID=3242416 RepID=UPI0035271B16